MTTDISNPWGGINTPSVGLNVLLVDSSHPHSFFWGKDTKDTYLLVLEIEKENVDGLDKKLMELRGVSTDIRLNQVGQYLFVLCLQNKEDADIFHRLCIDLIDRTKGVLVQKVALEIIHNRLKRWKLFLSREKSNLLTIQEIRGLFAELEFLFRCVSQGKEQFSFIEGWQGPLDGPHDFVLGDFALEIKSVTGSQKDHVRISSENQLSTHLEKLFLQIFFLAEFHDCKKGLSLNGMVDRVRAAITESDDREHFESRLYETGYMELKDYETPCFAIVGEKTYEVVAGFPRITPETLTEGLANVSYDLDLNTLEKFVCESPLTRG